MSTDSSLSSSGIPRIPLLYTGILRYTPVYFVLTQSV